MQYVPDYLLRRARRLQPDKDDLAIEQQVISVIPTIFSVIIAVTLAALFFWASLPSIALAILAIGIAQTVAYLMGFTSPRWIKIALAGFALVAIGANLFIHAEAGGFESGMWALGWLPLVPLAIFFVGGRRLGMSVLALVLLTYVVAALLDQRFAASPLTIPHNLKLIYDVVMLFSVSLMGFTWAEFQISELDVARQQTDNLLLNVLPKPIAGRLKKGQATIADNYEAVTILFADIVDFTPMSAVADPVEVVNKLNEVFSDFDDLAAKYGLEKIKTVGDAYMVAGGLPEPRPDHVEAVAAFAMEMIDVVGRHRSWTGESICLRVGINTGPIVAGVIGRQKFIYDVWGDAVNVASRMESKGLANEIQVTAAVRDELEGLYDFVERDPIEVKGKGLMVTYLMRPLDSVAADQATSHAAAADHAPATGNT